MLEEFRAAGYRTENGVLNAADFGVPQCRRRAFLVGTRTASEFAFPEGTGETPATVRDAIADLPQLKNGANVDRLSYGTDRKDIGKFAESLRPSGPGHGHGQRSEPEFGESHREIRLYWNGPELEHHSGEPDGELCESRPVPHRDLP